MNDDEAHSLIEPEPLEQEVALAIPVATPVQTTDEEIYCPVCGYNLTGVYSGRCPECGSLFDRDGLIAAQQAHHITLIPWDDPEEMAFRTRLYATLRICLVSAERFAFAFSVQPRRTRAFSFFAGTTAASVLMGLLTFLAFVVSDALFSRWGSRITDAGPVGAAVCLFVFLTVPATTLLGGVCLWIFCPHYDGKRHFMPWISIAAYAAAHYLLIGAAVPVAFLIPIAVGGPDLFVFIAITVPIWLGCGALCVLTLRAVVYFRTAEMQDMRSTIGILVLIHAGIGLVNMPVSYWIVERVMW